MADRAMPDRLQASLLDRLTDYAPTVREEPLDAHVMNRREVKQAVLRDLTWLFNAARYETRGEMSGLAGHIRLNARNDLDGFPEVRQSVLNFGLPTFSGLTVSALDLAALETAIQRGVAFFEPRILPSTFQVTARFKVQADDSWESDELRCHNVVSVELRGQLWWQPAPIDLLVHTEIDLETGAIEITDAPSA